MRLFRILMSNKQNNGTVSERKILPSVKHRRHLENENKATYCGSKWWQDTTGFSPVGPGTQEFQNSWCPIDIRSYVRTWHLVPSVHGKQLWKQCQTLFLGGSKLTADGDCSHEIKRLLFLGRKTMTNLDSILKSRDITLPTKVRLVKVMVFPVVMYGCESWTIKKKT